MMIRYSILTTMFLSFIIGCGQGSVALDSDIKKSSYAIGQQIGKSMKSRNTDVDVDALAMAINDVLGDKKSQMTDEDMKAAMQKLQQAMMAKQKEVAEGNKAKGAAFLAENKKREGVKTTHSGMQYEILKAGTGAIPKPESRVKVHYKGTLIDGTEFDSSYKRKEPSEFGVKGVIRGWTEALTLMKTGAKWKIFVPSELAYGSRGRPSIPPNSALIFEVELLEIVKAK